MRIEVKYKDGKRYRNEESAPRYKASISRESSGIHIEFNFGSASRGIAAKSGWSSKPASVEGGSLRLAHREAAAIAREILWLCENPAFLQLEMDLDEFNDVVSASSCRIYSLASFLKVDKDRILQEARKLGIHLNEDTHSIPWDAAKKIYLQIR